MLRAFAPRKPRLVFTSIGEPNALPATRLLATWNRIGGGPAEAVEDLDAALKRAAAIPRKPEKPLVVAGSLYLVGAVRSRLLGGGAAT
jgi:folylpolyglutamate synthase/dihydropteroate synthase